MNSINGILMMVHHQKMNRFVLWKEHHHNAVTVVIDVVLVTNIDCPYLRLLQHQFIAGKAIRVHHTIRVSIIQRHTDNENRQKCCVRQPMLTEISFLIL